MSPPTQRATWPALREVLVELLQTLGYRVLSAGDGEQALSLHLLEAPPSLAKASRKPPEQMAVIVEDLIKMLDGVGNNYRRGRYPDSRTSSKVASVLRAVADELELRAPAPSGS